MKTSKPRAFAFLLLAAASAASAQGLTIYEIQYTTNADGASVYASQLVNCAGGIVTHKYAGSKPKLTIQDPNYPQGWGAIQVKDWLPGAPLFNRCSVGDWVRLTNVYVEEYRGNTILQCWSAYDPNLIVISSSNPLPQPIVVDVNDITSPVCTCIDLECDCYVADHNAEKYESMLLRVENVFVKEMGLGKAADNYVLQNEANPDDANQGCWAADYMNEDKAEFYHPYVHLTAKFCAVEGILEQYTNLQNGWDYYQLITTKTADFTLRSPADLNMDCRLDFHDFSLFAPYWQNTCTQPDLCGGADLDTDGDVDEEDLGLLVINWLNGT